MATVSLLPRAAHSALLSDLQNSLGQIPLPQSLSFVPVLANYEIENFIIANAALRLAFVGLALTHVPLFSLNLELNYNPTFSS